VSLFEASATQTLTSRLSSVLTLGNKSSPSLSKNTHALTVVARIQKDPQFIDKPLVEVDATKLYVATMATHGDAIRNYAREWSYDSSGPKEVERKIEQLVWMNAIIYGIAGWKEDEEFNADFI
jgi:Questin oxidase-like